MWENNKMNNDDSDWGKRFIPQNKLEVDIYTITPDWGTDAINPALKKEVIRKMESLGFVDPKTGEAVVNVDEVNFWALLGWWVKDVRLSFLKQWEVDLIRYWGMHAHYGLRNKFYESFGFCLNEIAGIVETSSGRNGNLRQNLNTIRTERIHAEGNAEKIFNKNKGDNK